MKKREKGYATPKVGKTQSILVFVACLLLAFGLWIYAVQANYSNYEETFSSIPVTLLNTSFLEDQTGLSVISGDNTSISVTLVGKKEDVSSISGSDITATADVSTLSSFGSYSLNVSVRVNSDSSVSVKSVSSSSITVYVDEMASKMIPVEVRIVRASLPVNYVIDEPVSSVKSVEVFGPKSTISTISSAVAKVDFDNQIITSSMNSVCPLILMSSNGSEVTNPHVTLKTSEVNVYVPLLLQKEVPLKVTFDNDAISTEDYSVQISPSRVNIIGDPSVLSYVDSILVASLNPKSIDSSFEGDFTIVLPSGVSLVDDIRIASVNVSLSSDYVATTKQITISSIKVINGSIPYTIETSSVDLSIRAYSGNSSKLMYLSSENIEVLVDLEKYKEGDGRVKVPCSISFASQFSSFVYEVGEYFIQVSF